MFEEIDDRIKARVARILDAAELALDPEKFEVFRRITLNEFGDKGLRSDLAELFETSPD